MFVITSRANLGLSIDARASALRPRFRSRACATSLSIRRGVEMPYNEYQHARPRNIENIYRRRCTLLPGL